MSKDTRREFIKKGGVAAGAALLATTPARVFGANDRVRVGMIGLGGRGHDLLKQLLAVPNAQLVAVADIYSRPRNEAEQLVPGVRTFDDHRRMLETDLDAVGRDV